MTAALSSTTSGRGGLLFLEGAAGSGKSRMLEEAIGLAEGLGLRVWRGGAEPDTQQRPFSSLLSTLGSPPLPLLDREVQREIAAAADTRWWLVQETHDRLERVAAGQPVLVALDDLQWCDPDSLASLHALIPRLATSPVLWLVTARERIADATTRAGLQRLRRSATTRITLPPLAADAVSEVVADAVGARPDRSLLAAAGRAEGLPLLLVEMLNGLREHGLLTVEDGLARVGDEVVTADFADLICERLGGTSPTAQQLVRVAALLGREFRFEQLADLLEQQPASLLAPVQELVHEQIVQEVDGVLRFRHDLVREAIESLSTPEMRRAVRRRAVDVQLRRGSPLSDVASMLAETAMPGDEAAVDLLRQAAVQVSRTSAAVAAELSRRALELSGVGTPTRSALVGETVRLLWQAGRPQEASELAESSLLGTLSADAEAAIRLGFARLASQFSFAAGVQQTRAALALPMASDELRAELLGVLALLYCNMGAFSDVSTTVTRGLPLARATGNLAAEATLTASASVHSFYRFDWDVAWEEQRRAVDLAERAGIARTLWVPEACWTSFLGNAYGNTDQALRVADAGVTGATEQRQGAVMRLWMMERCRVLLDAGRLAEARVEVEAFADTLDDLGPGNFADATVYYTLGRCAILQADAAAAAEAAPAMARMQRDEAPLVRNAGSWLAALIADARGDTDAAMTLVDEAFATLFDLGPSLATPDDPMDLVMLTRISLRAGRHDRAAAVVEVAEERASLSPSYPVLRAAAAQSRGLLTGDADPIQEAVEQLEDSQRPLARASALEDLGRVTAAQDRQRAAAHLSSAFTTYHQAGAHREAQRVQSRLRELGIRSPRRSQRSSSSWRGLTAAELEIARLVVAGSTNRQIAGQLFLSPHTVGTHLRHVYEKLSVHSRVELTHALSSAPRPSPTS